MHEIALLPGGDSMILHFHQWLPIVQNQESTELWVDFWRVEPKELKQYIKTHLVKKLVFYDIIVLKTSE